MPLFFRLSHLPKFFGFCRRLTLNRNQHVWDIFHLSQQTILTTIFNEYAVLFAPNVLVWFADILALFSAFGIAVIILVQGVEFILELFGDHLSFDLHGGGEFAAFFAERFGDEGDLFYPFIT